MRRAVDAQQSTLAGAVIAHRIAARADIAIALGTAEAGRHRPCRSTARPAPIDIAEAGLAQAASGRKEGEGFQEIGLARPVRSAEDDRPMIGLQLGLRIAAEVAEPQPSDMGPAGWPRGEGSEGNDARLAHHTRIGIST